MLREIREQPDVLERQFALEREAVARLAEAARSRPISLLYIAARGTSDHAAIYAKYLLEILAGLPVALAAPSVVTLYRSRLRLQDALVLGISQSGRAADATEVLRAAREAGALTACITNDPESPMARLAEFPLDCHAGPERSLPATKTYTASLALVYTLAACLCPPEKEPAALLAELDRVPERIREALAAEEHVAARAERYRFMEECVVLARGINQCSALETALKLSETSYLRAHPYSAADFLHGPIAVVEEGYPCILFAPGGAAYPVMADLAGELEKRGAEIVVFSDRDDLLRRATTALPLPAAPELLSPIVGIVTAQLFAYHLARVKGRDPDRPRGLRKVTRTL